MEAPARETIAAISTAIGAGAIAVVRLSGDRALEIAGTVFSGPPLSRCDSHTIHYGHVVGTDGEHVDEVLASVLLAPHTYTTENMVEFSCHGGSMAARRVLEVLVASGARLARRGEFTERAFLGGRIDLIQAEAVADIVSARTRRGLEVALGQLEGGLSDELGDLRREVIDFRAEVEALIDFAEEDEGARSAGSAVEAGRLAVARLGRMLRNCEFGLVVREGATAAIVGRPNVGKSSLMNALLMRDRSIVTPLPGTTRDVIEEHLHVSGVAVRLIDTAGWREPEDEAEAAGVARARAAAAGADIVLLVVDASDQLGDGDRAIAAEIDDERTLVVANKIDLGSRAEEGELSSGDSAIGRPWVRVSSKTGAGLDALRDAMVARAAGGFPDEPVLVSNARHVTALRACRDALNRGVELLVRGEAPELAAVEIGDAASSLGEMTGETTPDDVLRRIFERFCVGK